MPTKKTNSQKSTAKPSRPTPTQLKSDLAERDFKAHQAIADALATLVDNCSYLTRELYDALFSALPRLTEQNTWFYQPELVRTLVPGLLAERQRAAVAKHERWLEGQRIIAKHQIKTEKN